MSPDIHHPKGMENILLEIDQRPFLAMVTAVVGEVSPKCDVTFTRDVMRKAIRCACLLDLFSETKSPEYLTEFVKQRTQFYTMIPVYTHDELESVEYEVKQFFKYEQILHDRIQQGYKFSWTDIEKYIMGKSSDNIFYGRVLELLTLDWTPKHSTALRTQTILFDIGKDIMDYEEDAIEDLPNILYMALTTSLKSKDIPRQLRDAVRIASKTGIAGQIIDFAARFKNEISTEILSASPTLQEAVVQRFEAIRRGLHPF